MKTITLIAISLFGWMSMAYAGQNCYRIETNSFGYDSVCLEYLGEPTNSPVTLSILREGNVVDQLLTQGESHPPVKHCTKEHDCWVDPRGVTVFAEDADFEVSLFLMAPFFEPGRTAFDSSFISLKKEGVRFLEVNGTNN